MEEIIEIPNGVEVRVDDKKVAVSGKKGRLERDFDDPRFNAEVSIEADGGRVVIKTLSDKRKVKALVGSMRSHIFNMMRGAQHGYKYTLKVVYTHFPMNITVSGGEIHVKNYLGEKGARIAKLKGDVRVHVDKEEIFVTGHSLEDVGQTAANLERACKLRGRDRRIFQDGIYIFHKSTEAGEEL